MRYKKEQDKAFYMILDAFKTIKPAEKDAIKAPSVMGNNDNGKKKDIVDVVEEKA